MKQNKNIVILILLILITLWFTGSKILTAADLSNQYTAVSIRLKNGGITEKEIKEALKKEKERNSPSLPETAAWNRIAEAAVKNEYLGREQKVSVIIAAGDMKVTVPMTLISGNYVYPGDKKGCVLDSKTAYALFGTEYAVSNVVTYEKKNYILRGIIKTDYPVFLIQGEKDNIEYSNLELTFSEKERGEALAGEFLLQNGLAADYMIFDGYFYGRLIHSVITLPVWFFTFFYSFQLVKYYIRKKNILTRKSFLLYGFMLISSIAVYCFLLHQLTGSPVYIPEKLIPTKWSDFGYWSEQYKLMKDGLKELKYAFSGPKDIFLLNEISKLSLTAAVITVLHLMVYIYVHLFTLRDHYPKI
jgi:hypothetical protein